MDEEVLALVAIVLLGTGGLVGMAFSPIGRALADRIRGRRPGADPASGQRRHCARPKTEHEVGKVFVNPVVISEPIQQVDQWPNRLIDPQLRQRPPGVERRPYCRVCFIRIV